MTWSDVTSPQTREFVEQLAEEAADLLHGLRAHDDSAVDDAARFLLETLKDAGGRLEQATLEVARAALDAGVPAGQLSQWTGQPSGVLTREIEDYEQSLRSAD